MFGLAWSETPFSKFGPYFEQLESKLAFLKLHFRRCRCYSVELYYGAVLGDTFLPSFPPNVVTANGRSDSVQISTQWCNSTRHQSIFIRNVRMANPRGYALLAHTGQTHERVRNSRAQVYERGGKSVNSGCKRLKRWLTDAYWAVKRTRKLPWLRDLLIVNLRCNKRYMKWVRFLSKLVRKG